MRRLLPAIVPALMIGALTSPEALAALPPVDHLFGCPLLAPAEEFRPPDDWEGHPLPEVGAEIALPPGWELKWERGAPVVDREQVDIALRRGRLVTTERLAFVRHAVELRELGPSHAGPSCEAALVDRLRQVTGWDALTVGVYARPLGWRRRHFALYVGLPDGSLTVVLRLRWDKDPYGPDLALVRRLLGGIRPITIRSDDPGATGRSAPRASDAR
ncbi:MAG: hypothetical protein ACQEXJ_15155 [Myxococcota bacterium]